MAVAFGIALAAAVGLVGAAIVLRTGSETASAPAAPVVDLRGIPQAGSVLGSPSAMVTLVEYADPQCPACRNYTQSIFPNLVDEYVRTGKVATEFRGFPFIGEDSVEAHR